VAEIKGVLLVPAEGDPHELLAEGPCGARPPVACWDGERWRSWADNGWWCPLVPARRALVLAWDGKDIKEGYAWASRAASCAWLGYLVGCALGRWTDELNGLLDPDLPGALVLIDADGREVKNE
jgi:hypothetical protein